MSKDDALKKLRVLMVEVFYPDEIQENIIELKMGDLPQWDSLGNFNLLLECESVFGCRFPVDSIPKLNSIRVILDTILKV